MLVNQFFPWLHASILGRLMVDVTWLFQAMETVHFIGLSILLGAMLLVDMRLLGFFQRMPLNATLRYTHIAAFGLVLNVASGTMFVAFDALRYWNNPAFRLKMIAIVLAIFNILYFELFTRRRVRTLPQHGGTETSMKIAGALSLLLWITIICLGRLLPTFEVPPELNVNVTF